MFVQLVLLVRSVLCSRLVQLGRLVLLDHLGLYYRFFLWCQYHPYQMFLQLVQ